jgi:imidazolonepropionase-like amidohydrolase
MRKLLSFSLLFISVLLQAQSHKTLILAGKLFESETGEFLPGKAIIIDENKIKAVVDEKGLSENAKKDYVVIDLSNFAVLPGLIDAHTHLLNKESLIPGNEFSGLDMMKTLTMRGDAYRAIYGSVRAKAYLEAGITAVQDLGNSGQFADIALRKAITEGLVSGPRMRCAGMGLASEGGQMPDVIYKHRDIINDEYRIVVGRDDAVQAVRENITQGADVIKIYSNNTPNRTALSVEEMQAIVKEAHRYGLRVTAHATDNQAVYNAVISGVDGIEHGYDVADSTLELMAKKGVVLVPTDGDSLTFIQYAKQASPDNKNVENSVLQYRKYLGNRLKRAIKKGVIIVAGSDDYIDFKLPFAEPSKRTLIGYFESGMSIPEVLKAATINASKQLNWGNSIGIIKPGFLADLIAVDKDLDTNMQAILNVHFVMKNGKVYINKNQ